MREAAENQCRRPVTSQGYDLMVFLAGKGLSARKIGAHLHRDHHTVTEHIHDAMEVYRANPSLWDPNPANRPTLVWNLPVHQPRSTPCMEKPTMNNCLLQHFILYKILEKPQMSTRCTSVMIREAGFSFKCGKTKVWEAMQKLHIGSSKTRQLSRKDRQLSTRRPNLSRKSPCSSIRMPLFFLLTLSLRPLDRLRYLATGNRIPHVNSDS
jgi:hypothetical protein